jgi:NAD(P)-dependent dehydrogenase (short-subunit alcohol dehydrogenase family)
MKKILITGSKGLIGKKVFNYLKKKNKVYGIDKHNVDLSNENEVKTFFKKNNNFDYLINLHGANEQVVKKNENINLVFKNDLESFNHYFHNNVFSFYLTNKYFIKFNKNGKGIINFSSIFSLISPKHVIYDKPKNIFYVSSKFAVNGITKYFSTMYGKKMNINTIANHGIDWKQPSSFKKKLIKSIPKGRMMKTQDLYGIIDYLCSSENTYMNGSTIVLDGGYSSW